MVSLRDKLLGPTEKALSKALALQCLFNDKVSSENPITEEEAKKLLSSYLSLDDSHSWIARKIYAFAVSQVNWKNIIDTAMKQEVFREVAADLISYSESKIDS